MTAQTTARSIDLVLSRLDKVKPSGKGRWVACCPAHADKSPSLSISETADGTVLIHCFAGCKSADVVSSAGLELSSLFPGNLSFAAQLCYRRKSLTSARDHCRLLLDIAQANATTLDVDDLLVAAKAEGDLPKIEGELQAIDEQLGQAKPDNVFIPDARDYVRLPESFRCTVVGKLAARVAHCLEFPEASAALALLTGASAAVSTAYAVQYRSGTSVQAGIYATIEQPPSMMKSRLLSYAQGEYQRAITEHNSRVYAHNSDAGEDEPRLSPSFTIATDATTAALDENLSHCAEGRFFIASAEQAAFQTLFPDDPKAFSTNNALLLNGWQGEFVSGMRKGRRAFAGTAFGSVLVIAQPGSAARVFKASNGTGLAERFFYMAEPSPLGSRKLHDEYVSRDDLEPFNRACRKCVEGYSARAFSAPGAPQEPEILEQLKLTQDGYALLLDARRRYEPTLGKLARDGELLQVGWLGKIETHALKVAAVLHAVECLGNDCKVASTIPTSLVQTALDLVEVLGAHLEHLLHDSGETGEAAEIDSVIELVTSKAHTARTLAQTLRKRHPFRGMGKEAYQRARSRIDLMLSTGRLIVTVKGVIEAV